MRPIVPFIGFVCLVLLLGVLLLRDHAGQPEAARSFPALQLKALDGKAQWSTESLYGQVTVINVFASWCASCAAESWRSRSWSASDSRHCTHGPVPVGAALTRHPKR